MGLAGIEKQSRGRRWDGLGEVDSQGATIEEARDNLVEALSLFFECADPSEVERRFQPEVLVTQVEVRVA